MSINNWRKISPVDLTGLAGCVALTAVFVIGLFWPLWVHRTETAAQIDQLDIQKSHAAQLEKEVKILSTDLAATRLAMSKNPLVLEPEDHLNKRLSGITLFSKKCGLEIGDIVPGSAVPAARYDTISIRLTGHGSYRACMAFLHELHENFLDTSIRGFRLTGNPQETAAPLSVEFDLVWYAKPGGIAQTE